MCTVTWLQDGDLYRLFCNRDELRIRKAALPPQKLSRDGVAYLAPVDGEAGGTWLAANEHALTLCLVNDYRSPTPKRPEGFTSRGQLVTELASARDLESLELRWRSMDPEPYRPFRLLALAPDRGPWLLGWNGSETSTARDNVQQPLSSSSFDDEGAETVRRRVLDRFWSDESLEPRLRLRRFHRSHLPERGPYSACMHRPDAVTVSFSLVETDGEGVSLAYAPGPPCSTAIVHLLTLARADAVKSDTAATPG